MASIIVTLPCLTSPPLPLQVFHTVDEATRCWIKGKQFSLAGLLADTQPGFPVAASYKGGSMAIFRLAPQDYHRFHAPCEGTIESIKDVPGQVGWVALLGG